MPEESVKVIDLSWTPSNPDDSRTRWKARHKAAVLDPQGPERPIVLGLKGWIEYAQLHLKRFDSNIGDDYVLGPAWAQWGMAMHELLNGEIGRLDAGTISSLINDNIKNQGLDPEKS